MPSIEIMERIASRQKRQGEEETKAVSKEWRVNSENGTTRSEHHRANIMGTSGWKSPKRKAVNTSVVRTMDARTLDFFRSRVALVANKCSGSRHCHALAGLRRQGRRVVCCSEHCCVILSDCCMRN